MKRHGSIYMIVLGTAMLVTVVGVGALSVARVSARTMSSSSDWEEAGVLATSATEQAISAINAAATASPSGWRSGYVSGATAFTNGNSRKNFSWILIDEIDGNITNSYLDPIRLYGVGKVGSVTRVYSLLLYPAGSGLDVLRCAVHAAGTIQIWNTAAATGGPYSSNGLIRIGDTGLILGLGAVYANLWTNVEAQSKSLTGTLVGTQVIPAPAKTMPPARVFDDYTAKATTIAATNFGSGKPAFLLSSANNPFGTVNPDGVYAITIPTGQNLIIRNARIRGTLLISGSASQSLDIGPDIVLEPARPDYPSLIVKGVGTVNLKSSVATLNETPSLNLNPTGSPYKGIENAVTTDQYPTELSGLIHVINGDVTLGDKLFLRGCIVTTGALTNNGVSAINADPNLLTTVPLGYSRGDQMIIYPGSYRWDSLP